MRGTINVQELDPILERCRRGDNLAWEALVRRTQSRVYGLALQYVRDPDEASDLAQEIFIKIYRNLDKMETGSAFMPWLVRLSRNCCIDRIRRIKARPPARDVVVDEDLELKSSAPSPEQSWDTDRRKQLVYQAMGKLSEQNREILLLKEIQQLKLTEIAGMLGLPVGTIKSRASRARVELAKSVLKLDPSYGAAAATGG
ncbi:MAG: sigma-70 family RNA polymerase sigma factor [Acidobacteria bacterium]|uniref:Sigma-70 family RNA polymerase sigma factor n=1 Tax=Candidatus Polarisedimenticola svalbardensis TaxID=2886004 RepID=A0A8J6Y7H2_9BACT|nr:sigma-70 family RNA polymerase sigma factor [Candidatus Polarisedimenticola svalbardensis]